MTDEKPCDCPICTSVGALRDVRRSLQVLDQAIDDFVEDGTEYEGSLYYLLDEVRVIAESRWAYLVRRRLLRALKVAQPRVHANQGKSDA